MQHFPYYLYILQSRIIPDMKGTSTIAQEQISSESRKAELSWNRHPTAITKASAYPTLGSGVESCRATQNEGEKTMYLYLYGPLISACRSLREIYSEKVVTYLKKKNPRVVVWSLNKNGPHKTIENGTNQRCSLLGVWLWGFKV